ncbi:MAG: putative Ig domain-containing protein [Leptospiraceae bacterium]|nr:putative Ig domain-containing protein [Leptospiraceae bacterium]
MKIKILKYSSFFLILILGTISCGFSSLKDEFYTYSAILLSLLKNPPIVISYEHSPYTLTKNSSASVVPTTQGSITTCSSSPTLPDGLSLDNTTCEISGTPTSVQSETEYIIKASKSTYGTTTKLSIIIEENSTSDNTTITSPTISITGSPFTLGLGTDATITPTLGGGTPTSCSISPSLSTGLTINSTTCVISGTPTVTQTATDHTITVGNSAGSNSVTINITVSLLVAGISSGGEHTCALSSTGDVKCWGRAGSGQLGYGNTNPIGNDETPDSVGYVNVGGGTVTQISAGYEHTCALLSTGDVKCWGRSDYGQLGYGNTTTIGDDETPDSVGYVNVGGTATQISAGYEHTCALLSTGDVKCWGRSDYGQLGYGNTTTIGDDETPASVGNVNVGGTVTQISSGQKHTCALLSTGDVRCWGRSDYGQLGYGNTTTIGDDETPASVGNVNVGGTVTQISTGYENTCALLSTGDVKCWGRADSGQLGYGNINNIGDDEIPASIGNVDIGETVIQVSSGLKHTCVLLSTGNVKCWGEGNHGRLGYGSSTDLGKTEVPSSYGNVNVGGTVTQISAGDAQSCVLLSTGYVMCWGRGSYGRLGYGNENIIGDDEEPASVGNVQVF